ncbi:MAG: hypothetical protein WDN75_09855 [Bacteroidota bacterium]
MEIGVQADDQGIDLRLVHFGTIKPVKGKAKNGKLLYEIIMKVGTHF